LSRNVVFNRGLGPIGCPQASVINYNYSLRNNPEDRSSQLLRGGRLNSYVLLFKFVHCVNPGYSVVVVVVKEYIGFTVYDVPNTVNHLFYRGADKSLARPGRKQATATEDFEFHISYLLS
jgi:hypothetical protein